MDGIELIIGLGKDKNKEKHDVVEKSLNGFKEIPDESKKNVRELSQFVDSYLTEARAKYGKEPAIKAKLDHIDRVVKLVEKMKPNDELAVLAAKSHDLGRIPQFEILGKFDDGKILHHNLGEDLIGRWMFKGEVKPTEELAAVRQVVMFHGRSKFMPFTPYMPEYVKNLVNVISRADGIENGCVGFMEYGEREIVTDAKSFNANNPNLDMKSVSPEVLDFFLKGEKFDKMKYCKTYAEYTLITILYLSLSIAS
jgi:hypothetical protein